MPLYVYTCPECEIMLEELHPSWRAAEPVECPVCHGLCVREISQFSLKLERAALDSRPAVPVAAAYPHDSGCPCCRPLLRRR